MPPRDSDERNACMLAKHVSLETKFLIATSMWRGLQSLGVFMQKVMLQLCCNSLLGFQESESTV
ncbi:hypothetical protein HBI56_093900 [Parastagonospora nodorum]|uniref:Uncharacterized protein n=1 Tax=Phaeosphaeria nodorum (strain SN15 / ATCC MYA-4574 / FGSC 10173) TaxID=321614 RepID=A0A7U2F7U8_PHANO|nr:hypothetical protein HBH56_089180 [Parastagonospora nodorum]QRC98120.1 hypothetical protein JI435_411540 [Parastagonospora nodorum SN15]KAH3936523.1 hypothetical protein HBH54_023820 [Parastagonospora nodorum]KAH3945616.1 hypothetical protein HBH53_140920 [Parastagonospora nodorum]KAH3966268.1 hypothetical protein HBH51_144450 [Parastagonospora nodorum]